VEIPEEVSIPPVETQEEMLELPQWGTLEPISGVEEPEHQPDPRERWMIPAGCVAAALVVLWIISPKKPKKRNRRERPKMNWDIE
jgi:hypothetical protein